MIVSKKKVALFFFLKYLVLYLFLMVKNSNYKILKPSNYSSLEDISYYLLLFLPLPIIMLLVFSVPIYYSLKSEKTLFFTGVFVLFLVLEYFIYTHLTSQQHIDKNGLFNALISLLVFTVVFREKIKLLMKL